MATATQSLPLPPDIRLMNNVSALLFGLFGAALLVAGAMALARLPLFQIQVIHVHGEVARNNVTTIRANAMPKLSGSFFTLDLEDAKHAFESVPWVRRAVVKRIWPNRLEVRLEEHKPAAYWGDDQLVNVQGEIFDANLGDVEEDGLPTLQGPDGSAPQMLAMETKLEPLFTPLDARIEALTLSGRGSWRVELDTGAEIELGRGSDDEVIARTQRFVRTLPQLISQYQRPLKSADLRHRDGYALRLRGVATAAEADKH